MATTLSADRPAPRYTPHELIAAFAVSCILGGLLTDLAYWKSAEFLWADFSAWLVSASVVAMVVALVAALIDYLIFRSRRRMPRLSYLAVGLVVLVLATFNMMIHSRDAWTSVVPWGLTLSAVTVLVLLAAAIWRTVELRRACREVQP
ncbi:DUF2231 domain-containing protein [Shinella sp.]|uniref:DUF2231 domain-containing protein n=1 Tax=Shinella sp. TaxID=1870904 RepID=UPI00301E3567